MRVRSQALAPVRHQLATNTLAHARHRPQQGYLLVELAITLMLVGLMAIYTRTVALQEMDDGVAAATGTYVLAGAAGLETYLLANAPALAASSVVSGVANAYQPTLAELEALKTVNNSPVLPQTFAPLSPTRQALQFDIQRIANAGGTTELRATACLNAPLRWRGAYRDDLVTVAMQSMAGRGGRSVIDDNGATIRGALISSAAGALPNPVQVGGQTPVGILCSVNVLSDAFYSAFARQQDGRNLTFSGAVNASGTLNATGTLNASGTVNATGQVDASGASVVLPTTAGGSCTAAGTGAFAWLNGGSTFLPARCNGTTWVATGGLPVATAGANCATVGALAMSVAGTALICQGGVYADFVSRMGALVAMSSYFVSDGIKVDKPSCVGAGAQTAIYLFPLTDVQQSNSVVVRSASSNVDNTWTVSIKDGDGVALSGQALAMTYCVY